MEPSRDPRPEPAGAEGGLPRRLPSPAGAAGQSRVAGSAFVAGILLVEAAWIAAIVYCTLRLLA